MIQIVFGSLDTDYDLITGLYDIGCPALHTVFTYPVRLKFGTADLPFVRPRAVRRTFSTVCPVICSSTSKVICFSIKKKFLYHMSKIHFIPVFLYLAGV